LDLVEYPLLVGGVRFVMRRGPQSADRLARLDLLEPNNAAGGEVEQCRGSQFLCRFEVVAEQAGDRRRLRRLLHRRGSVVDVRWATSDANGAEHD
jgi:hypothetical protein